MLTASQCATVAYRMVNTCEMLVRNARALVDDAERLEEIAEHTVARRVMLGKLLAERVSTATRALLRTVEDASMVEGSGVYAWHVRNARALVDDAERLKEIAEQDSAN
jgi:hypothetical protein